MTRAQAPGVARAAAVTSLVLAVLFHRQIRPAAAPRPSAQPLAQLRQDIDATLSAPELQATQWGILVQSLGPDAGTVYALNERTLMMPASSLKIVTLAAAAERLGWDFSYETRLVTDGTLRGDTLDGDLLIVGSGDPSLDREALESWSDRLRALGISRIGGRVIADSRAFGEQGLGSGWSWDDLAYYYAAPIAAAQFNENAVEATLTPGAVPGAPVAVALSPAGSGLEIDNRMRTDSAGTFQEFVARRAPGSSSVVIEGTMTVRSPAVVRGLSVPDPARFLAAALTETLVTKGIRVSGAPGALAGGAAGPASVAPLFAYRSPPLSALARRLMDVSQNQYAETLIMTLGANAGTPTFDRGLKVVEEMLAAWGIGENQAVLRDGSGLSRYNYISPDAMVAVLTHEYRDPAQSELFFSSLTLAGRSGRIAMRLRNTAAEGHVRAKDGSMAGVRALCGIITMPDARPLVFAIFANGFSVPGPTITAAIDAIVLRLANYR